MIEAKVDTKLDQDQSVQTPVAKPTLCSFERTVATLAMNS